MLTTNRDDKLVGGEFVELKDADGYRISPFNSTIPTATKLVSSLSMVMQNQLVVVGEDLREGCLLSHQRHQAVYFVAISQNDTGGWRIL